MNLAMNFSKKTIIYLIAIIWIVFSVFYVANNIWGNFKNTQMSLAYQQGMDDLVAALFQEAEECQPFPVFSGDTEMYLIKFDCLEQAQE
jgi:uncharacterized protein YybS (DUF2232 family)